MKNFILIAGLFFWFCSQTTCQAQSNRLKNTKWVYSYDDCQGFLEFGKKNNYKFFSCETGNIIYGKYTIKGNEVLLNQVKSEFDKAFRKAPPQATWKSQFKLLVDKNSMRYSRRWDIDKFGKWVISKYEFDQDFVFVKEGN